MPQLEIPVVERPVLYRALGQRQTASSATGATLGGRRVAATETSSQLPRQAVMHTGPRVSMQGGVRVFRGS
jgi:hypothetical protein